MVRRHENLKIWQKSYDLARDLMETTMRFPRPQQTNGLGSEIRRTALDLLETVMLANDTKKIAVHKDIDHTIDRLQVLVRMSRDLGYAQHADTYGLNCQIAERHPFLRVAFDPVEAL